MLFPRAVIFQGISKNSSVHRVNANFIPTRQAPGDKGSPEGGGGITGDNPADGKFSQGMTALGGKAPSLLDDFGSIFS